jgi:hypothetical protein
VALRDYQLPTTEQASEDDPRRRRRTLVTRVLLLLLVLAPPVLSHLWWRVTTPPTDRILLVDYTVPFESAREHRGATWILNHRKYVSPTGTPWASLGTHLGYDPRDRDRPHPISAASLTDLDWVFVTDAYGVYEDDLRNIKREMGHMDYSRRLFGGVSDADADSLQRFADAGGHLFLEFNTLEEPTSSSARRTLSALVGTYWTGWVGRTFASLRDTTDVPHWLPRLYAEQYPGAELPRDPSLVLIHADGRLRVFPERDPTAVAPRVAITAAGDTALGSAKGGSPYTFWFSVLTATDSASVLAELVMPDIPSLAATLDSLGLPRRLPLITRRIAQGSHRIYVAGDLSDADFRAGWYQFAGIAPLRALLAGRGLRRPGGAWTFWQFTAPAYRALLEAPHQ